MRIVIVLSLLAQNNVKLRAAEGQSPLRVSHLPGSVGETGHLFLVDEGFYLRPFYNDVYGKTDKHLTHAVQAGYLRDQEQYSLELVYHWRLYTPAIKSQWGGPYLRYPVGRYADWINADLGLAKIWDLNSFGIRGQVGLGGGHVGDHGAKVMQRATHRALKVTLFGTDYDTQPRGFHLNTGAEGGVVWQWSLGDHRIHELLNAGFQTYLFMTEAYLSKNYLVEHNEHWRTALEYKIVHQLSSRVYGSIIKAYRHELALGMAYKWYTPSIKYVGPYLNGDEIGQIFFDPLSFQLKF